jgi:hypothetical protein
LSSFKQTKRTRKLVKAHPLIFAAEINSRFFQGVPGTAQSHMAEFPESEEAGTELICGRKQNIGVEKYTIHL